jgi:hypothetical protein
MTANAFESRRTFLHTFLGLGAAAVAVSACQLGVGGPEQVPYQVGVMEPAEVVALRPGVHYADTMPARVPAVRLLKSASKVNSLLGPADAPKGKLD